MCDLIINHVRSAFDLYRGSKTAWCRRAQLVSAVFRTVNTLGNENLSLVARKGVMKVRLHP